MANLRRSKDVLPARSRADGRCKKHPKHGQSPGVCPICLCEKLSQLSNSSTSSSRTSRTFTAMVDDCSSSSSVSSYYSSSSESSYSSPMRRYTMEGKGSWALFSHNKNVLTKSRSLAFVPRMRTKKDGNGGGGDKIKKSGFWSKFLHPRSVKRREEGDLMHSRTMREVIVTS